MALENEYEKLLNYLDTQKPNVKPTPKKTKTEIKKEQASKNTQKLIQEATIDDFKDIPHIHGDSKGSAGFNVLEFESMMRSKLIEKHKTSQSYERPYVSCSELYTCLRQTYYTRKRYKIDISSQFKFSYLYLIQEVGNAIHSVFQELYNFTETEKTVISENFKVKGRVDAIKNNHLYEIKTLDADKFTGSYIKEHYLQGIIYAYILMTEYDYKIDKITIIYVLRNLKTIRALDVDVDMSLAKKYLSRAPLLISSLDSNIVIDPIGASSDTCKWCSYIDYCKKDGYTKTVPPYLKKEEKKIIKKEEMEDKNTAFLL